MSEMNMDSGKKYYTAGKESWVRRLKDNDTNPDAVERVLGPRSPRAGQTVKELHIGGIDGEYRGATIRTGKYGEDLQIILDDGVEQVLQMSVESGAFRSLAQILPNVDLAQPFGLILKEGRISVWQNDAFVKYAHTAAEPNGMPESETKIVKGKEVKDHTEKENFLYNIVIEKFGIKPDAVDAVKEAFGAEVDEESAPF